MIVLISLSLYFSFIASISAPTFSAASTSISLCCSNLPSWISKSWAKSSSSIALLFSKSILFFSSIVASLNASASSLCVWISCWIDVIEFWYSVSEIKPCSNLFASKSFLKVSIWVKRSFSACKIASEINFSFPIISGNCANCASSSRRANSSFNCALFNKKSFSISNLSAWYSVSVLRLFANSVSKSLRRFWVNSCSIKKVSSSVFALKPCSASNNRIKSDCSLIALSILFWRASSRFSFSSFNKATRLTSCSDCCPVIRSSMSTISVSASACASNNSFVLPCWAICLFTTSKRNCAIFNSSPICFCKVAPKSSFAFIRSAIDFVSSSRIWRNFSASFWNCSWIKRAFLCAFSSSFSALAKSWLALIDSFVLFVNSSTLLAASSNPKNESALETSFDAPSATFPSVSKAPTNLSITNSPSGCNTFKTVLNTPPKIANSLLTLPPASSLLFIAALTAKNAPVNKPSAAPSGVARNAKLAFISWSNEPVIPPKAVFNKTPAPPASCALDAKPNKPPFKGLIDCAASVNAFP